MKILAQNITTQLVRNYNVRPYTCLVQLLQSNRFSNHGNLCSFDITIPKFYKTFSSANRTPSTNRWMYNSAEVKTEDLIVMDSHQHYGMPLAAFNIMQHQFRSIKIVSISEHVHKGITKSPMNKDYSDLSPETEEKSPAEDLIFKRIIEIPFEFCGLHRQQKSIWKFLESYLNPQNSQLPIMESVVVADAMNHHLIPYSKRVCHKLANIADIMENSFFKKLLKDFKLNMENKWDINDIHGIFIYYPNGNVIGNEFSKSRLNGFFEILNNPIKNRHQIEDTTHKQVFVADLGLTKPEKSIPQINRLNETVNLGKKMKMPEGKSVQLFPRRQYSTHGQNSNDSIPSTTTTTYYNSPFVLELLGGHKFPMTCDTYRKAVIEADKRRAALQKNDQTKRIKGCIPDGSSLIIKNTKYNRKYQESLKTLNPVDDIDQNKFGSSKFLSQLDNEIEAYTRNKLPNGCLSQKCKKDEPCSRLKTNGVYSKKIQTFEKDIKAVPQTLKTELNMTAGSKLENKGYITMSNVGSSSGNKGSNNSPGQGRTRGPCNGCGSSGNSGDDGKGKGKPEFKPIKSKSDSNDKAKSKKQSSCSDVGKEYKPKCNTTDPCEPKKAENPCSKRNEKKSSNPCEKYQKKTGKSDVKGKSTILEDKKQSGPCAKKDESKNALDPCNKKPDPCAKQKSNTSTKQKPEPCNKKDETKKSPCSKEEKKTETSKSHLPKKELRTEEKDKKPTSSTGKVEIKKNPSPCSYKKGPCAEKPRSNSCGREKKKSSPCKRAIKKTSPCSKPNKKKTTDPCSKRKQTAQEKPANDCAKKSDESKTQNPCEKMKTDVPCSKTTQSSGKKPRNTKPNCKPQGNETKKCYSTEAKSHSDLLNQQKRQCSTLSFQKASLMNKNFVNFGFMRHFNSKGKTTKTNSDLDHGRRSKCKSLEVKKPPNRQNDQVHQSKHSRRICYPVYDMECPKKLCKNPQKQQSACRKPKFLKDSDNNRGKGRF